MLITPCASVASEDTGITGRAGAQGQALGHAGSNPDAGKSAGTPAEGNGVNIVQAESRFRQHTVNHRQDQLRMPAGRNLMPFINAAATEQRSGTGLGSSIQCQNFHIRFIIFDLVRFLTR